MRRRLIQALVGIAAAVSVALAVPMLIVVSNDQHAAFISRMQVETLAAASILATEDQAAWGERVAEVAASSGARVVVVGRDLTLLADSDNSGLDRGFARPEIEQALAGRLTSDARWSNTLGVELRYVAAPVISDRKVVAAVRLSLPDSDVDAAIRSTQLWLALFVVSVVAIAAVIAFLLARSIASPLRGLAHIANRLPEDLTLRANERKGPTEVRDVAAALNLTAERLMGMIERSHRVAAEASHHLRTPLTGLRLRLEAIEDLSQSPEVTSQAVAAGQEVERLSRRIDQILQLARSDASSEISTPVAATEEVANRVSAAEGAALAAGIELTAELTPDLYAVVPAGVIPRTVDELIGNALLYAKSRIRVSLTGSRGLVELTVEDDGRGVAPEELDEIFVRFSRGSAAVPGGSGLGLAMVAEAAQAAGGTALAARSALGGLLVSVRWPMA